MYLEFTLVLSAATILSLSVLLFNLHRTIARLTARCVRLQQELAGDPAHQNLIDAREQFGYHNLRRSVAMEAMPPGAKAGQDEGEAWREYIFRQSVWPSLEQMSKDLDEARRKWARAVYYLCILYNESRSEGQTNKGHPGLGQVAAAKFLRVDPRSLRRWIRSEIQAPWAAMEALRCELQRRLENKGGPA